MSNVVMIPGLPFTLDEVNEAEEARKSRIGRRGGDGQVCLCGHPFNRHSEIRGVVVCQPTRMSCGCKDQVAALVVQDTRVFLRKTVGVGINHALTLGLKAAVEAGHSVEWVIPTTCSQCGAEGAFPVGMRRGNEGVRVVTSDDGRSPEATRLLCKLCMEAIA